MGAEVQLLCFDSLNDEKRTFLFYKIYKVGAQYESYCKVKTVFFGLQDRTDYPEDYYCCCCCGATHILR